MRRLVNLINNSNENKIAEFGTILRLTRDDKNSCHSNEQIRTALNDLKSLSEVVVSIQSYTDSLQLLSPSRRIEIEDKIKTLQKIKIAILLKQPLLADSKIKDYLEKKSKKNDFTPILDDTTCQLFQGALESSLHKLLEARYAYSDFLNDAERPISKDIKYNENYLNTLVSKFPHIMTEVLEVNKQNINVLTSSEKDLYCRLDTQLENKKIKDQTLRTATDVTVIGISFISGPIGRGIALATSFNRAKLIEWGLIASSETYFSNQLYSDYSKTLSVCDKNFSSFSKTPNLQGLTELENCHKELSDKLLTSSLATVGTALPITSALYKSVIRFFPKTIPVVTKENLFSENILVRTGAARFSSENGNFTVFNLGTKNLVERKKLEALSDDYLGYVSDVYTKRLNLKKEEIESFIETSKTFKDRTVYIINTKPNSLKLTTRHEKAEEIQGGIGLVSSQNKEELLPLEKATGINLDRSEGGVAEIVRLTTNKENSQAVATELLDQISKVILVSPDIQTVYIYTSKAHARLYKRYGPFVKEDRTVDGERDMLLKIDVNDLRMQYKMIGGT